MAMSCQRLPDASRHARASTAQGPPPSTMATAATSPQPAVAANAKTSSATPVASSSRDSSAGAKDAPDQRIQSVSASFGSSANAKNGSSAGKARVAARNARAIDAGGDADEVCRAVAVSAVSRNQV